MPSTLTPSKTTFPTLMKRLSLTVSLILGAVAALRAEAPPVRGTLPEDYVPSLGPLLKEAVERSPRTIEASLNLAHSEGDKYVYASSLWPQLSGSSDYAVNTASQSHEKSSTGKGIFYAVALNQPLFQWGALKNNARVGELAEKISAKQYADVYRQLAVEIRGQYISLIEKKISLRNARYNQKLNTDNRDIIKSRVATGAASPAELSGADLSLQEATLSADQTAEDFAYAKRVFSRLVGVDDLSDESIPNDLPHPEFSAPLADAVLAGFVGNGVESTFQSEVYKMLIEQQDLNYTIAKVRLLPKVSAAATYMLSNATVPSGGTVSQYAVSSENYSVQANWSIFDGFATRGAKLQSLALKRTYEQQRKEYVDATIDKVHYLRRQLDLASRAMTLSEVHRALIESDVNRIKKDVSLGFTSQAAVDQSLVGLYSNDYNQATARGSYLSQWTEFVSVTGIDPALENLPARYVK